MTLFEDLLRRRDGLRCVHLPEVAASVFVPTGASHAATIAALREKFEAAYNSYFIYCDNDQPLENAWNTVAAFIARLENYIEARDFVDVVQHSLPEVVLKKGDAIDALASKTAGVLEAEGLRAVLAAWTRSADQGALSADFVGQLIASEEKVRAMEVDSKGKSISERDALAKDLYAQGFPEFLLQGPDHDQRFQPLFEWIPKLFKALATEAKTNEGKNQAEKKELLEKRSKMIETIAQSTYQASQLTGKNQTGTNTQIALFERQLESTMDTLKSSLTVEEWGQQAPEFEDVMRRHAAVRDFYGRLDQLAESAAPIAILLCQTTLAVYYNQALDYDPAMLPTGMETPTQKTVDDYVADYEATMEQIKNAKAKNPTPMNLQRTLRQNQQHWTQKWPQK